MILLRKLQIWCRGTKKPTRGLDENTLDKLDKMIKFTLDIYRPNGITVFLENNSKLDPIFTDTYEIEKIFRQNEELEFILDYVES